MPSIKELWIKFGRKKSMKFIPVYDIVLRLGKLASIRLMFFCDIRGCSTTSSISGKGNISFLKLLPEITPISVKLSNVTLYAE